MEPYLVSISLSIKKIIITGAVIVQSGGLMNIWFLCLAYNVYLFLSNYLIKYFNVYEIYSIYLFYFGLYVTMEISKWILIIFINLKRDQ